MRTSSWISRVLLTSTALLCVADIRAGDQRPEGLPHEVVTLHDGRRLSGYYDPFNAILWLDGPYRARLRLRHGDVIRRTPINDAEPARVTGALAGGAAANNLISIQRVQNLRLREQQVAELDRRKLETVESIRLLTSTLESLDEINRGLDLALGSQPEGSPRNETLITHQRKIQQQIADARRRLAMLQDQVALLTKRREQFAAILARARSATSGTPPEAVVLPDVIPDPMIEMRLRVLEDEVRALRADNQELRRLLDALAKAASPPAVEPPANEPTPAAPPASEPVTPPAVEPPAVETTDEVSASEQVARRA